MSTPNPNPTTPTADLILARTTLALAKSRRLIATWLPPPTADELLHTKAEADIEREEQELFTPVPELYHPLPLPSLPRERSRRLGRCWC